jgi:glycosyltransferase involved in cell wall biosynthesis
VYLFNFYLHDMGTKRTVKRVLSLLLGAHVAIMTQSPNEASYYLSLCRLVDSDYYPFCMGEIGAASIENVTLGNAIFSGGYTNRDYDLLLDVARRTPGIPYIVACSRANKLVNPPPNVLVVLDTEPAEFHRLMASSRMVVIPLDKDVGSSGQMVTIAAMQLGKTVVYSDYPVVAQFFDGGAPLGLSCTPGDADIMTETILSWYDRTDDLHAMGVCARAHALEHFLPAAFEEHLCQHVSRFIVVPGQSE